MLILPGVALYHVLTLPIINVYQVLILPVVAVYTCLHFRVWLYTTDSHFRILNVYHVLRHPGISVYHVLTLPLVAVYHVLTFPVVNVCHALHLRGCVCCDPPLTCAGVKCCQDDGAGPISKLGTKRAPRPLAIQIFFNRRIIQSENWTHAPDMRFLYSSISYSFLKYAEE
jgi:hypothetical protein